MGILGVLSYHIKSIPMPPQPPPKPRPMSFPHGSSNIFNPQNANQGNPKSQIALLSNHFNEFDKSEQKQKKGKVKRYLDQANRLFKEGRYNAALKILDEVEGKPTVGEKILMAQCWTELAVKSKSPAEKKLYREAANKIISGFAGQTSRLSSSDAEALNLCMDRLKCDPANERRHDFVFTLSEVEENRKKSAASGSTASRRGGSRESQYPEPLEYFAEKYNPKKPQVIIYRGPQPPYGGEEAVQAEHLYETRSNGGTDPSSTSKYYYFKGSEESKRKSLIVSNSGEKITSQVIYPDRVVISYSNGKQQIMSRSEGFPNSIKDFDI